MTLGIFCNLFFAEALRVSGGGIPKQNVVLIDHDVGSTRMSEAIALGDTIGQAAAQFVGGEAFASGEGLERLMTGDSALCARWMKRGSR